MSPLTFSDWHPRKGRARSHCGTLGLVSLTSSATILRSLAMAKRAVTVELEEAVLDAARAEAQQTGRSESEVVEGVLSRHFETVRASIAGIVWSRNANVGLTGDEALALAYEELESIRRERREADNAASSSAGGGDV
jgi:hypothetical protein